MFSLIIFLGCANFVFAADQQPEVATFTFLVSCIRFSSFNKRDKIVVYVCSCTAVSTVWRDSANANKCKQTKKKRCYVPLGSCVSSLKHFVHFRPMFEEDVPSVLELEMEELDQWMKKEGRFVKTHKPQRQTTHK